MNEADFDLFRYNQSVQVLSESLPQLLQWKELVRNRQPAWRMK